MNRVWQAGAAALCAVVFAAPAFSAQTYRALRFDQLLGWKGADHSAALTAFLKSCQDIAARDWAPLCKLAATKPNATTFFETFFIPVVVRADKTALFTGYFEPILNGSLKKVGKYRYPVYKKPKDMTAKDPTLTRAAIDAGSLKNKGLVIAYVDDPVALYYLHIQGSGSIRLSNGNIIRVGYAAQNGFVYRSVAKELVRRGEIRRADASIKGIRAWYLKNPNRGRKALEFNASYVFFRKLNTLPPNSGPYGALDRPLTALRSIAVDPKFTQMGAPVWIEKGGRDEMRRLMVAQDVGSAIKGPQRADIFFGTGLNAGQRAGQTNDKGRMVELLPIPIANRLAPAG